MKTSLDPRHLKRQKIVQELFAWQAHPKNKLTQDKARAVSGNFGKIDKIISDCAPEWTIDKINPVDLAILRLAVYELCLEVSEPPKVVIDEAVELAKEFGGETSPAFINGALAKALFHQSRTLHFIANKLGADEKDLSATSNFYTDLNATELEMSDIVTILENDLHLAPPPSITAFKTVGQLLDYVEDHNE